MDTISRILIGRQAFGNCINFAGKDMDSYKGLLNKEINYADLFFNDQTFAGSNQAGQKSGENRTGLAR
jgi:hypothetical protein